MEEEHREEEEEERARPRPRVVDKRVSSRPAAPAGEASPHGSGAGGPASAAPSTERAAAPPADQAAAAGAPEGGEGVEGGVWTPEREARAQEVARQIAETPALEWVVNVAVTLANVAGTKIDMGQATDARLAIEALAGLIDRLGTDMGDAETPLRSTLAQLQMAYAQAANQPPA